MPLTGRASVIAQLLDEDSAAFPITNAYSIKAEFLSNPDSAAVLLTKTSGAGEVTALSTAGYIYVPLAALDIANFGVGKLLTLRVSLIYVNDGVTIRLVNHFYVIPLNQLIVWSQPTEVAMALSTQFKNTVKSALGEAYLDTILCVNQPVGCSIEIYVDGDQPPQNWILVASQAASVAGATRRAIDYAAGTNEKVWFRE